MDALASMMMVDTLSSRISLSSGVGSRLSSSILTDSVSLEMRKPRTSSSNRSRPEGGKGPCVRAPLCAWMGVAAPCSLARGSWGEDAGQLSRAQLALLGRWDRTSPDLHMPVSCHLSAPKGLRHRHAHFTRAEPQSALLAKPPVSQGQCTNSSRPGAQAKTFDGSLASSPAHISAQFTQARVSKHTLWRQATITTLAQAAAISCLLPRPHCPAPPGEPVPGAAARTAVSRCVPVCSKPSDAFSFVQSEGQSPQRPQGPTPSAHAPHLPDLISSHSLSAMLASSFTHMRAHTHTCLVASAPAVPSAWNALLQIPTRLRPSPPSDLYSNVTSSTRPKPTSPFQIPPPAPALPVPVIFLYLS